jgi:hypothetical protein
MIVTQKIIVGKTRTNLRKKNKLKIVMTMMRKIKISERKMMKKDFQL